MARPPEVDTALAAELAATGRIVWGCSCSECVRRIRVRQQREREHFRRLSAPLRGHGVTKLEDRRVVEECPFCGCTGVEAPEDWCSMCPVGETCPDCHGWGVRPNGYVCWCEAGAAHADASHVEVA